jgi:hypothetical protein
VLASASGFYGVAVALPSGQPLDWSAASTPVVNPAERAR